MFACLSFSDADFMCVCVCVCVYICLYVDRWAACAPCIGCITEDTWKLCNATQKAIITGYRDELVKNISAHQLSPSTPHGSFLVSCPTHHCQVHIYIYIYMLIRVTRVISVRSKYTACMSS